MIYQPKADKRQNGNIAHKTTFKQMAFSRKKNITLNAYAYL